MKNIEIISKGSFIDDRFQDKKYLVTTITFRLLNDLMNDYIMCDVLEDKEKTHLFWVKIIQLLGENSKEFNVTNVLSEIFTLVIIKEIGDYENEK